MRTPTNIQELKATRPDVPKALWAALENVPFAVAKTHIDETPVQRVQGLYPQLQRQPASGSRGRTPTSAGEAAAIASMDPKMAEAFGFTQPDNRVPGMTYPDGVGNA